MGGVLLLEQMRETTELLREYAESGSESAFRELVEGYINLVYSTARRLVSGDAHLAEDVTQEVFVHLSQKAGKLSRKATLGGWLHRDTCFVASKARRAERRRQAREREAVLMNSLTDHSTSNLEQLAPVLDEAVDLLGEQDRLPIVLRFFEQRDFRAIGLALGTTEDAARMRLNRALEKLQGILKRRGVVISAAALTTLLASETVSAAPVGLAGIVAGSVLAGTAAPAALSASFLKIMAITKLKSGLIAAVVIAGAATSLLLHHRSSATQRAFDDGWRQHAEQLSQLRAQNQRLAELASQATDPGAQETELTRLRTETYGLRRDITNLPALRREHQRLLTAVIQSRTPLEAREELMAKGAFAKNWVYAFVTFSLEHDGRFPTNFDEAAAFLQPEAKAQTNITTSQFEIVYQGNQEAIADPAETIVLREKQPWVGPDGSWVKMYGFADGTGQLHSEPDGNFEAYERQHTVSVPAAGK